MLKAQPATRQPTGSKASTQDGPAPAPGPEAQNVNEETGRTEGLSDATEEAMKSQEAKEEQDASPNETKEDKFKRLGKARTNRALTAISSIGKLSGSSYASTDEQRAAIFRAIRKATDDAEASFKPKGSDKPAFDFA